MKQGNMWNFNNDNLELIGLQQAFNSIANKESVFVSEFWTVLSTMLWLSNIELDIAPEKYFYSLIGFPINKMYSQTRVTLIKMLVIVEIELISDQCYCCFRMTIMVEIGINIRDISQALHELNIASTAFKSADPTEDKKRDNKQTIELTLIKSLFIWVSVCLAVSVSSFLIEIIVNTLLPRKELYLSKPANHFSKYALNISNTDNRLKWGITAIAISFHNLSKILFKLYLT